MLTISLLRKPCKRTTVTPANPWVTSQGSVRQAEVLRAYVCSLSSVHFGGYMGRNIQQRAGHIANIIIPFNKELEMLLSLWCTYKSAGALPKCRFWCSRSGRGWGYSFLTGMRGPPGCWSKKVTLESKDLEEQLAASVTHWKPLENFPNIKAQANPN